MPDEDQTQSELSQTITNIESLKQLLDQGLKLNGPRGDTAKDLSMIEKYFGRGYEFVPEPKLLGEGYQLVEPSQFTKGLQFAYKTEGERLDKYYKSQYTLVKKEQEIPLYLEYHEKD
jgi:hypothetical protein